MTLNYTLQKAGRIAMMLLVLALNINLSFAQNAIVTENLKPGSPRGNWDEGDIGSIQGFATQFSVNKGSQVDFKIDIDANINLPYSVEIYRLGYYQGNGARFIADLGPLQGMQQPAYQYEASTGKVDCSNWAVSCSWNVPANAVSGVYVARLDCGPVASTALIIFVVRDDAANSPVLFKTSDATWQAYNAYGGNNFYSALTPIPGFSHATKLSYQRPLTLRGDKSNFFNSEYPMLVWLEKNGYDVSYATDMDMARDATVFTPAKHKVLLSVGHDEYWSVEQRTKFETARNNGVNIAWFSGNSVYWKTRWENNFQTLVCYKEGTQGIYSCGSKCDPLPNIWTGLWRDGCAPVYGSHDGCYPEGSLVAQMGWNETTGSIEIPETYKNYRIWKNTSVASLAPGQKTVLPFGTLGAEWDQEDLIETYPAHRTALSFTTLNNYTHRMAMYRNAGQGLVFSAGTMQWSWGLDLVHDPADHTTPISLDIQQATYNLLFDMGVQGGTKQANIITPLASTDNLAPTTIITSPVHNASVPGSPIVISGTSSDNGGGVLSGVEVSIDNGTTWKRAVGLAAWTYSFIPNNSTPVSIKVRGWDDVFNVETIRTLGSTNNISIIPAGPFTNSLFENTLPTSLPPFQDIGFPMELGMKFRSSVPGSITGFRYFKHPNSTGLITGHLWTSTGTLLATQDFTNETASGWQNVTLSTPVGINPNTTYVVSYFSPAGKYVEQIPFFQTSYVNGVLRGLADGEEGKNGVNNFNGSAFPTGGPGQSNYYADILFQPSTDFAAPSSIITSPVHNASVAGSPITVSGTSSDNGGGTVTLVEVSINNGATWNAATGTTNWTYSFTPNDYGVINIKVRGTDNVFNVEVPGPPGSPNCISIYPTGPFTNSVFDNDLPLSTPPFQFIGFPMELGMKFQASVAGTITGFRYYKHPSGTGTITGHLWTGTGTLIASQDFTSETASGWQSVTLTTPVAINANTTYVVSYFSPLGKYVEQIPFFVTSYVNGVLRGLADGEEGKNGVNNFNGSAFPTEGPGQSNYYADVLFSSGDATAPTVVSVTPLNNAVLVPVNVAPTATFNEPLSPGTVTSSTVILTGPGNTSIPGSVSVSGATVTFTPNVSLIGGTLYTMTLKGGAGEPVIRDLSGNKLAADYVWSFTTAGSPSTTVNLKLYLEGYYVGSGLMQPVLLNQSVGTSSTETDSITVEFHNATSPFALVASVTGVLNTNGTIAVNITQSGSFYIAIKHRNTIQTWSANPVSIIEGTVSYDFTTAASKAYGNNMKQIGSVWTMFTGDLNQDEFIDGNDFPQFDLDVLNGVTGVYTATDLNGDGFVDGNDFPMFDINILNGVQSVHP